jgi:hypothetical protein
VGSSPFTVIGGDQVAGVNEQPRASTSRKNGATAMTHEDLRPDEKQFCQLIAQGNSASKAAEVLGWPVDHGSDG